jgi:hypothetical protein
MKKLLPLINPASNWRQALVFLYRTNIFIEGDNSALQHEAINLRAGIINCFAILLISRCGSADRKARGEFLNMQVRREGLFISLSPSVSKARGEVGNSSFN